MKPAAGLWLPAQGRSRHEALLAREISLRTTAMTTVIDYFDQDPAKYVAKLPGEQTATR